jgi:hypothetical protein
MNEWSPDDLLKALTLLGAAFAFPVGLIQYRRGQRWKRAEWVAQEMKSLFGDPVVQAVFLMMDWGSRRIALYPDLKRTSEPPSTKHSTASSAFTPMLKPVSWN